MVSLNTPRFLQYVQVARISNRQSKSVRTSIWSFNPEWNSLDSHSTHKHTHTHIPPLSQTLYNTLSQSYTRILTLYLSLTHTHTLSIYLYLNLYLTHTQTHTQTVFFLPKLTTCVSSHKVSSQFWKKDFSLVFLAREHSTVNQLTSSLYVGEAS